MTKQADLYQVNPAMMSELTSTETDLFNRLLRVWGEHAAANCAKQRYYDAHNRLERMGLSIPEGLRDIEVVSGWGAKAVDCLASRSVLKEFTARGEAVSAVDEIVDGNDLFALYDQAVGLITSQFDTAPKPRRLRNGAELAATTLRERHPAS